MTPESARLSLHSASADECGFALQRIGAVDETRKSGFGNPWPWFELLIRPNRHYFSGSPGAFINKLYAERMPEVTDSEVLARAVAWLVGQSQPTRLSINVHPQSLTRARFLAQAMEAQGKVVEVGHSLCLELVEFGECPERSLLARSAQRLRDAGLLIALDDFGTRLNFFDMCAEGVVDLIKVDASVVRGVGEDRYRQAIVQSIKTLTQGIDAKVIAEGVETTHELESLSGLGVDYAQGYLYHRPEIAEI